MLVILIGLIFFIYILPVKLAVNFSRQKSDDYLTISLQTLFIDSCIKISYLDFRQYFGSQFKLAAYLENNQGMNVNLEQKLTAEEIQVAADWLQEINKLFDIFQLISLFTDNCVYFYCQTSFGFNNPAYTGLLAGGAWGIKGILDGVLNNLFNFKYHPVIKINPKFNSIKSIEIQVKSIFKFKIGNIIITGIKLLSLGLRRGLKQKYEPTSN